MSLNAVIGNLRANLGLDTAQFDRGLSNAQGRLARAQQGFMRFAGVAAAVGTALGALGVSTINSAREISNLSKAANAAPGEFQRWAAAAETVGVQQDKMADILKDVNDRVGDFLQTGGGPMADFFENIAPQIGVTAEQFAKLSGPQALQLYVDSLEKAGLSQSEMTFYLEAMSSDLTLLQPLLRNGGEELERLGDRAEGFGAVMDQKTIASLTRTKQSLEEVQTVFRGFGNLLGAAVAPIIERTANAFVSLSQEGAPLNNVVRMVAANMERLMTYATTFAAFMAGKWVAAFVAARVATISLSTALGVFRAALIRTGIGALVVVAGELVYWFMRLIESAGGFGDALSLLKDVALEVWDRITLSAQALQDNLTAAAKHIASAFVQGFAWIAKQWDALMNMLRGPFNSMMEGIGLEFRIDTSSAGDALQKKADELSISAGAYAQSAGDLLEKALAPLESLQGLRDAAGEAGDEMDDGAGAADRLNESLSGLGRGAGGGGASKSMTDFARAVASTREETQRLKQETASLLSVQQGTRGVGDAMAYARKRAELLAAAQKAGLEVTPELTGRVNELASAYARAGKDAQSARDDLQSVEDQADRGADAIGGLFSNLLDGTKSLSSALSDLLGRMADMALSSGFQGIFGGGGPLSGVGDFIGGLIGANANGTRNWRGGWTMVGERGRELVNLPQGSQVMRNPETEQMMGGAGGAVEVIGGDLTLSDNGEIMARVQVVSRQQSAAASRQEVARFAERFNTDGSLSDPRSSY